jgi:hypothetical protein
VATRRLVGESWDQALSRVGEYPHPLAVAWAANPGDHSRVFDLCVREATTAANCRYVYDHLELGVDVLPGVEAEKRLREGRLDGTAHFIPLDGTASGTADWVTSHQPYGVTSTLEVPAYYYDFTLPGVVTMPNLDAPLFGGSQPYYPSGSDALLELLYGITRHQKTISFWTHGVIRLPYLRASIRNMYFVEGQGITIEVHEQEPGGAAGHELHVAWISNDSDQSLSRGVIPIDGPGSFGVQMDLDPAYISAALLVEGGPLVDSAERYRTVESAPPSVPLHPAALPEAFDFFASVWKDAFGERLLQLRTTSTAAALSLRAETKSDFESRLSSVSALLKAISVPDSILSPADRGHIDPSHSTERMKSALRNRLSDADLATAMKAISVLGYVNDLRVALQHPEGVKRDLPTALARFNIGYPPDWSSAWDVVRARLISSLGQLRDVLQPST